MPWTQLCCKSSVTEGLKCGYTGGQDLPVSFWKPVDTVEPSSKAIIGYINEALYNPLYNTRQIAKSAKSGITMQASRTRLSLSTFHQ